MSDSPIGGDVRLVWDAVNGRADLNIISGALETGHDLETAVIISLFTDQVADPGDILPADMRNDPRGFWADTYEAPDKIGSKLWQLMGRVRNQDTLNFARDTAEKALQWMIDDGVASAVTVEPSFYGSGGVLLQIGITEPSGAANRFEYLWGQES